jgi:hypothetical protein
MSAPVETQAGSATLSLREISDRLQIQDALLAYATALDVPGRRWDQWYRCFTEDAVCEFPGIGAKSPAELQELFTQNDATRLSTQHLFLNIVIALDGDAATSRSECSTPRSTGAIRRRGTSCDCRASSSRTSSCAPARAGV